MTTGEGGGDDGEKGRSMTTGEGGGDDREKVTRLGDVWLRWKFVNNNTGISAQVSSVLFIIGVGRGLRYIFENQKKIK